MSDTNPFNDSNKNNETDENLWYHPRTSSPHSSLCVNNSFTQQSSPATMGSWGFDVNRSTNGHTPLSFTSNNNNHTDQQIITRTRRDYNERLVDIPSSSQNSKFRTPALTRHRNGNEFDAVDRLLFGPNRPLMTTENQQKIQTEHELLAWQNRTLQRNQRTDNQSPILMSKGNEFNSLHSSNRQISDTSRHISGMLTTNDHHHHFEHDHHESSIKIARVIKRYIELIYHLQSFYERMTDQLFNGNNILKTNQTSSSLFTNHCRKIAQQLQILKPIWEEKVTDLQNLLKDMTQSQRSKIKTETTVLQRRLALMNLLQILSKEDELDETDHSIRTDIDRLLYEDKLAVQLQDELSTLLQHQSLLNDFTSLLQWNRPVYAANEQNRVETILPLLREQITTTDNYLSHVNQQLAEMVISLRSSEKYILSYTNTIPLMDEGIVPSQQTSSNHDRRRPYDGNDIDPLRTKDSRAVPSHRNGNINETSAKIRSTSRIRYPEAEESHSNFDRDDLRLLTKKTNINLNTNNSNNNNNGITTRFATVKSAKRESNSILKSCSHTRPSNGRRIDFDIDTEVSKPNRSIDFENDDQVFTTNERERLKKIQDRHRIQSKTNTQDRHLNDDVARTSSNRTKTLNLQSMLGEDTKEKYLQVAAKRHLKKSCQQRLTYPNA